MMLTIPAFTAEDKNSKLMSSEGMEATEEEIQESFGDGDGDEAMEVDEAKGIALDFGG
jgi:translation initiation factor eIF-2B subunit gamma